MKLLLTQYLKYPFITLCEAYLETASKKIA